MSVEKEIDKVLNKFGNINGHADRVISDLIRFIEDINTEFRQGEIAIAGGHKQNMCLLFAAPDGYELTKHQKDVVKQAMTKIKDTVSRLATDHRDLHGTVSKVGKAIDRNFVPDFGATSREDVFNTPEKIRLINKVICEHFCRHGLSEVAQELAKVSETIDALLFVCATVLLFVYLLAYSTIVFLLDLPTEQLFFCFVSAVCLPAC